MTKHKVRLMIDFPDEEAAAVFLRTLSFYNFFMGSDATAYAVDALDRRSATNDFIVRRRGDRDEQFEMEAMKENALT